MLKHMRGPAALGATLLMSSGALAHHAGGVGNVQGAGPINTISASTLGQGESVAGITVDYVSLDTLSDETLIRAAEAGIEDVHGLDSIGNYGLNYTAGLTNDLMVTLRLPYVRRTGIREVPHEHGDGGHDGGGQLEPQHVRHGGEHHEPGHDGEHEDEIAVEDMGTSEGIGDLSLLGQYRFLNDRATRTEAAVLLGVKAPTGVTDVHSHGELLEAEFQPGSGSWDALFGLALTHRSGAWSFDTSALYTATGEGTQDTELGDLVLYNLAVSYRLTSLGGASPMFHGANSHEPGDDGHGHAPTAGHAHGPQPHYEGPALDLVLEVNGEWHDKQVAAGVADDNSGGSTVYVSPGMRLSIDQWSGFLSVGIPVANDLNGIQAEPDWRVSTGTSLAF